MNDLHGWITQQVDRVEADARSAEKNDGRDWTSHWDERADAFRIVDGSGILVADQLQAGAAALITAHDPAAVLRRCEADRRILADHCLVDTGYSMACEGCGTAGICQDWVTDSINDCPMLLAIAYAHGLTDEILASLDRPQMPERPRQKPSGMGQLAAQLWDGQIRTSLSDVPVPLRGPNWSSR